MKKTTEVLIKKYLLLFLCSIFVISCDDDNEVAPTLDIEKTDITVGEYGGNEKIIVKSVGEWVSQSSDSWLMITPANGIGTTECSIVIDSTLINEKRTGTIRFISDGQEPKTVKIHQTGFDKIIAIDDFEITIEASDKLNKRNFSALVTTNVEFDIEIEYENSSDKWIIPSTYKVELDRGARPRSTKINFDWKMNSDPKLRVAKVNFIPSNKDDELKEPAFLLVSQKAAPKIEDNRSGDSLAIVTIADKLQATQMWDTSENLRNWENVVLWEEIDKDLPSPDAVGRIRKVKFGLFSTKETIPQEVRHLKYLETFSVYGNANKMLLSIDLGAEITELKHLKHLQIGAYGIVSLPSDFVKLGETLESLDLSSNNFTSIPEILNPKNFPNLKSLEFVNNRRYGVSDLRQANTFKNGIGLHLNTNTDNSIKNLFLWDNLEELSISYNYIEGSLPDFKVGSDGVDSYSQEDVNSFGGDTIQWLADNAIPKILPNMKKLSVNLNFFTGDIPNWLLYHPYLLDWFPESLIFNQMEYGVNSEGNIAKFDNVPTNFEYYFEAFPKYKDKYNFYEDYNQN